MSPLFKQKRFWIPAALILLVLLYAAGGFLLAPHLLRNGLIKGIHDNLGLDARVGEIRINPFLLQLEIKDFALPDRDGKPLLGFQRLFVDFETSSLWHRAYVFKDIDIAGPYANAVIARNGVLNFEALKPKPKPGETPSPKQQGAMPRIEIASFRLDRGAAGYEDYSRVDPIVLHFDPIEFELKNFTTGAEGGRFTFSGASKRNERLEWSGHFSLQPLSSDGEFKLTGLQAHSLWEYVKHQVAFVIPSGSIDLGGSYRFVMREQPDLDAVLTGLDLTDLSLGPSESEADWLRLSHLAVGPVQLNLTKRSVSVDSLVLDGLKAKAWMEPDHSINWQRLARTRGVATGTVGPARPAGPGNAAPWDVRLKSLRLQVADIRFQDRSLQPTVDFSVAPLNLVVANISQDLSKPLDVKLDAGIDGSAHLAVTGNVVPQPLQADAQIELSTLGLKVLQPYIAQHTALILRDGDMGVKGHAQLKMPPGGAAKPQPMQVRFNGDVSVDRLYTVDSQFKEDLIKWNRLQVLRIDLRLGPDKLDVDRVMFNKLYARVAIAPDRTLNIRRVLAGPKGLPPEPAVDQDTAAGKVASAKASAQSKQATPTMPINIRKIIVQASTMNFSDESLKPNFAAGIQALDGSITGVSSKPGTRAKIDFKGQVDQFSPVSIKGEANVLGPLYTDIAMSFRNMELTTFNPYSGKFAGYDIAKGKLTTELTYKIDGRKLDAGHHIIIDQLEFGEKTASKDAVSLPLKLAVALLKDRNGVIDLDVPVTRSLDDPHFRLGPVIWKVVRNLLVKIVTSPFALLGKMFGGGPDLQFVDFPAGIATLDPAAQGRIKSIAKALAERPQLKISVPLAAVNDLDRPALVQAKLDSLLHERQQEKMPHAKRGKAAAGEPVAGEPATSEAAAAPALDTLPPKQQLALLSAVYKQQTGSAPKFPDQEKQAAPDQSKADAKAQQLTDQIAFVRETLLKQIQVTDQDLTELAKARATAIQQILLTDTQIDPARVFLVANNKAKAQDQGVRLELTLE